ncbi:transposable element Tcb1 transposase [Trichonephila clavipes]|nr:transposable element Tcb1 transposase [Trichonephila clavipes]
MLTTSSRERLLYYCGNFKTKKILYSSGPQPQVRGSTMDRRGLSRPPRCTTVHDDRRIVRIAVMDRAATSRTMVQQIQSVMPHLVPAHNIRRRLQQREMSAKCPLLRLPFTGNHRRLRHQ